MASQLDLRMKADTSDLQRAKLDFAGLKDRISELARELPGVGRAFDAFESSLNRARGTVPNLSTGLTGLRGAALATGTAMGTLTVAAGGLGIAMAFKYNDIIDQLGDLAGMYGYTADQVYLMKTAAEQAGGSFEQVNQTFQRVSNSLAKSGDEAKGAGEAFKSLGIQTTTSAGQLRSSVEVTIEAVKRYNEQLEAGTLNARDMADYQTILGRTFQQSAPAILAAAEAQKMAADQAAKGIFISKEATQATNDYEKATLTFGHTMTVLGSQVVSSVIPAFTNLINWLQKSYETGGLVKALFDIMKVSMEALMVPINVLINAFQLLDLTLTTIGDSLGALFASIAAAAQGDFKVAGNIILDWLENTGKRWKEGIAGMKAQWDSFGQSLKAGTKPGEVKPPAGGGTARDDSGAQADKELMGIIRGLEGQQRALNNYNKEQELAIQLSDERFSKASSFLKDYALMLAAEQDQAASLKVVTALNDKLIQQYAQLATANDERRFMDRGGDPRKLNQDRDRRGIDRAGLEAINELERQGLLTKESMAAVEERVAAAKAKLNDEYAREAEYQKDWVGRGLDEYMRGIGQLDERMKTFVAGSLTKVEDGLMSLFTTGKFNFKEFVASILEDLLRMMLQFTIIQPILEKFKATMASTGAGGGGWGSAIASGLQWLFSANGNAFSGGNVQMLAKGDVISQPTYLGMANGKHSVGGEAGPEGILPLKRNSQGQLGVIAQGGGGGNVTQNNIYINIDSVDSQDRADDLVTRIREVVRTETKQTVSDEMRPGGMLNRR